MNDNHKILADILAKYLSKKAEGIRTELEGIDEAVNELAKIVLDEEKPQTKAEQPKAEKPTLDEISSLRYVDKTSEKGPYKTASKTDNPNNSAFQKLQNYIKEHNNFVILHGYKLWNFQNSDTIGRRKQ